MFEKSLLIFSFNPFVVSFSQIVCKTQESNCKHKSNFQHSFSVFKNCFKYYCIKSWLDMCRDGNLGRHWICKYYETQGLRIIRHLKSCRRYFFLNLFYHEWIWNWNECKGKSINIKFELLHCIMLMHKILEQHSTDLSFM